MSKQLITSSIAAPGFYGLNTQDSEVTLESGFARSAENCIIDDGGRLGSRKGWQYAAQTSPASTINLKGLHRFLDVDGVEYFGCWSDTTFYIRNAGTLTPVTYSGSQTIADGKWQAVSLFDSAFLFQENYEPIYFNPITGVLDDISNSPYFSGTVNQANTALSAYGRLWVADTAANKTTVWWSDLLSGVKWNSGTAGSLDIASVLPHGNDEIVALGAHNGYLIIFCKNNIIIYADSDNAQTYLDPATLQLVEVISGVGCIARDSVVNTGTDILFLSESGILSLGRTIQEKSQPMRDISKNIRDSFVQAVRNEDLTKVRATYSEHYAFYLVALPTNGIVYCFDMRAMMPDGSARVTRWNSLYHTDWHAYDNRVYMTSPDGLAEYYGYQDNGSHYTMSYYTNYFNLEMPNLIKIVKGIATTVIGSTGQKFVIKVATDYTDRYTSYTLNVADGATYEYNIAEYNTTAEYSRGALIDNIRISAGGSGFVIQLGFDSRIDGGFLNIQQIDLYVKQGRMH